jgi:hypothetical protein
VLYAGFKSDLETIIGTGPERAREREAGKGRGEGKAWGRVRGVFVRMMCVCERTKTGQLHGHGELNHDLGVGQFFHHDFFKSC